MDRYLHSKVIAQIVTYRLPLKDPAMNRSGAVILAALCTTIGFNTSLAQGTDPPPGSASGVATPSSKLAQCLEKYRTIPGFETSQFLLAICNDTNKIDDRDYQAIQPPPILNNEYLNFTFPNQVQG